MLSRVGAPVVLRLAAVTLLALVWGRPAAAQSGWTIDVGGERMGVTLGGVDSVWTSERVQIGYVNPEEGGWFGGVERHDRFGRSDLVFSTSAYRRLGDWTVAGGAARTIDADFWFRWSVNGEISRRLVGGLVASGGYRIMEFPSVTVEQIQPALTWYHRRGEVQARLFVTKNSARQRRSNTGLLQTSLQVSTRVRVTAAVARGDRIFDVGSLTAGAAKAWMIRGGLRIGISKRAAIEVGGGYAREEPGFRQRIIAVSVRRTF